MSDQDIIDPARKVRALDFLCDAVTSIEAAADALLLDGWAVENLRAYAFLTNEAKRMERNTRGGGS